MKPVVKPALKPVEGALRAPLFFFLLFLASACATAPAPRPSTRLRLDGNVPDATLWVDDHLVSTLGEVIRRGVVSLPSGYHRVEIRHPAYYSVYRDVDQADGGEVAWHVDLHPLLD